MAAGCSWEEPLYSPEELRGIVPSDTRQSWDVRMVLARLLDGSRFEEFKSNYGKTLVTGVPRGQPLMPSLQAPPFLRGHT